MGAPAYASRPRGAVAQLGERYNRTVEVTSSNLVGSTTAPARILRWMWAGCFVGGLCFALVTGVADPLPASAQTPPTRTPAPSPSLSPTSTITPPAATIPPHRLYLPAVYRSDATLDAVASRLRRMDMSPRTEGHVGEWAWKGGWA